MIKLARCPLPAARCPLPALDEEAVLEHGTSADQGHEVSVVGDPRDGLGPLRSVGLREGVSSSARRSLTRGAVTSTEAAAVIKVLVR
ncbi:hypothetical protein [Streptomyces sp. NPDC055189]